VNRHVLCVGLKSSEIHRGETEVRRPIFSSSSRTSHIGTNTRTTQASPCSQAISALVQSVGGGCSKAGYTRKNPQVVTNLQQTCSNAVPTTCQQDVFALLVDNLLQGCWAQQTCYKFSQQLGIVLQFNNLSTSCEWQPCGNIVTTCWQACYKPAVNTSCWQVARYLRVYLNAKLIRKVSKQSLQHFINLEIFYQRLWLDQ
jgi:hypothetical protein